MRWLFIIISGIIGGMYFPVRDNLTGEWNIITIFFQGVFSVTVGIVCDLIGKYILENNTRMIRWFLGLSLPTVLFITVWSVIYFNVKGGMKLLTFILSIIFVLIGSSIMIRTIEVITDKIKELYS